VIVRVPDKTGPVGVAKKAYRLMTQKEPGACRTLKEGQTARDGERVVAVYEDATEVALIARVAIKEAT
jgi:hypothetical protein